MKAHWDRPRAGTLPLNSGRAGERKRESSYGACPSHLIDSGRVRKLLIPQVADTALPGRAAGVRFSNYT
jgi:hypothetical protein